MEHLTFSCLFSFRVGPGVSKIKYLRKALIQSSSQVSLWFTLSVSLCDATFSVQQQRTFSAYFSLNYFQKLKVVPLMSSVPFRGEATFLPNKLTSFFLICTLCPLSAVLVSVLLAERLVSPSVS